MMKKTTTVLGLCALLTSPAFAAQLTLQQELVPRVLNGEFVYPERISANNSIQIKDGHNQLTVTVGQIVFEDGKRRKFDSQPLILEFSAAKDAELTLSYNKLRTIEEAKAFERDPKVTLLDESGNTIEFSMTQLRKGGMQGFRDYEREVADYNLALNKQETKESIAQSPQETQSLKASFNNLSREEQQEFMQWAMRNLK
ncbi:YccT family protein [Vibrio hepatarius]|uniref:UPF0319 protein AKJ31_12510 n=1 Tax=Vibrio hepatarius TaxID=171383 RepID=A0A0M0HZ11_9VIBR|nr:DUF2057 domain-containing protein [Vibrio hepatarius]KOO07331.1 hypothetical protein AKJ31_12510 [Vibrio hepatarius]